MVSKSAKPGASTLTKRTKDPVAIKKETTKTTKKEEPTKKYTGNVLKRSLAYLFEEEDAAYLAVFRILWGSIMAYEAYTYTIYDFGKMYSSFYNSNMQFKYYGFEWCSVPSDPATMKLVIIAQLIFGLMITVGFFYRTAALLFTIFFTYMYTLEQAVYLNHFYLVCLLSAMMVLLPCNCLFSVDAYLWKSVYKKTCPKWCLIFVKTELAIVYTYAGVAKMNEDWLRGEPLRSWLAGRHKYPFLGYILPRESTAYLMSYGGLVYDLITAELLLFKRTLKLGLVCTFFFHISNKLVFNIGIFPWMMIASTTFFLPPYWPRVVLSKLRHPKRVYKPSIVSKKFSETAPRSLTIWEILILVCAIAFLLHQLLIPLRLHLYPGTVGWTEYGHQFSWRMKLRTKKCDALALAYNPGVHVAYELDPQQFLNYRQYRKMASRPDMIQQFAHHLGDKVDKFILDALPNNGTLATPTQIYIEAWCELNSRPYQPLTVPTIDIRSEPQWQYPYTWVTDILPLSDEEKKNYPWNFEWNWNWLKGIDALPPPNPDKSRARGEQMQREAIEKWEKWMAKKDPNTTIIKAKQSNPNENTNAQQQQTAAKTKTKK